MMSWLHEQHAIGTYVAIYCNTELNKADMNTKTHGGQILQQKHLCLVGYRFHPEKGTVHYELLRLGEYNIGTHRGSFYWTLPKQYTRKLSNRQIYNIDVSKIHK